MSHAPLHDEDSLPSLRPRPRRPFELSASGPPSPSSSTTPTDPQSFPSQLSAALSSKDNSGTPSRTRSILNLTSSTLFGIYGDEPSTPWGVGAETPIEAKDVSLDIPDTVLANGPNGLKRRRRSTAVAQRHVPLRARRGFKGYWLPLMGRVTALFGVGMLYGMLVSTLHERQEIAPVKVEGIDRSAWPYYVFWGMAGVLLGEALPQLDAMWNAGEDEDIEEHEEDARRSTRPTGSSRQQGMVAWNDVVRSVGAFVGIAFAIRKLPWQSTLQLSLTLALANPAIWFLVDRSPPGFILSALFSLGGTGMLLGVNPALLPSPSPRSVSPGRIGLSNHTADFQAPQDNLVLGLVSHETVGMATWIASVLFVSCVCFGNIGRKLAPRRA